LEDVGRQIPVVYTCPGCGEESSLKVRQGGREVVENGKCVGMQVDVECPSCGEPFSKKYDFRDEPKADFRELDEDYVIPPLNLPEGLKEEVLKETSIDEVRVGYDLPPRWEPGDALPEYASPGGQAGGSPRRRAYSPCRGGLQLWFQRLRRRRDREGGRG
jgi:hypothetical protein